MKGAALLQSNTPTWGLSPVGLRKARTRATSLLGAAWINPGMAEDDLSPSSALRPGLSAGQRSRRSPSTGIGLGRKIKGQRSAEPHVTMPAEPCLRWVVLTLSRKPHHIILPSGTFAGTQQLLGPFARLSVVPAPNPSLSEHPPHGAVPDPVPSLGGGGPAPCNLRWGPPHRHLQPPRKTEQNPREPNPHSPTNLCLFHLLWGGTPG